MDNFTYYVDEVCFSCITTLVFVLCLCISEKNRYNTRQWKMYGPKVPVQYERKGNIYKIRSIIIVGYSE